MEIGYVGKCLLVGVGGKRILVIGDLHLGYEESVNEGGVFVSGKIYGDIVDYLDGVIGSVGKIDEVVLLGDVKHWFSGIARGEWNGVLGFFEYLKRKCEKIVVVKGNHDTFTEVIAKKRDVEIRDYYVADGVCFMHGDRDFVEIWDSNIKTWVLGHGHPAIKVSEPRGVKVEKYKCFLVGRFKRKEIIIVPSFFEGNVGSDPRERDLGMAWGFRLNNFEVKIVSGRDLEVLNFGKLGNI